MLLITAEDGDGLLCFSLEGINLRIPADWLEEFACMHLWVFFGFVPQPKTFMFSSVTDSKLPPGASPAAPLRYGDGWMVYLCRSH